METSRFSFTLYFIIVNIFVLGLNQNVKAQNTKSNDHSSAKEITILANQVAYNLDAPKTAIITSGIELADPTLFQIIDTISGEVVFTGKDGRGDGSGIDFKVEDNGNEWRWSEQWIPHTGWFLQAITAMSSK